MARGDNWYVNGTRSGYYEYRHRYGAPKAPAPLPKVIRDKKRRDHIINGIMDELRDWRSSPFENEGVVHASIRSALCLQGHSWRASDAEATSLVHAAFVKMGVQRPSYEQGQHEYSDANSVCSWCYTQIPEDMLGIKRVVRFCSDHCAKVAYVNREYGQTLKYNNIAQSAYKLIAQVRQTARECAQCGDPFYPRVDQKTRMYCSIRCLGDSQKTITPKPCKQCGEIFRPTQNQIKYCSKPCYHAALRLPPVECAECGKPFHKKKKSQTLCSAVCAGLAFRRRKIRRDNVIPFVPVHMLTAKVIDGWFARAA